MNTTADTQVAGGCDTDPQCSLRDAIDGGERDRREHCCRSPAGSYELNLPDVLGDLDVNADMTITGAGARSTIIDANELSRVLNVSSADTRCRSAASR